MKRWAFRILLSLLLGAVTTVLVAWGGMGGRMDMGADEFTDELFVLVGDINCDCAINAFDIEPFLLALFEPEQYVAINPTCDLSQADLNGDGSVDAFDIEPFLELLFP